MLTTRGGRATCGRKFSGIGGNGSLLLRIRNCGLCGSVISRWLAMAESIGDLLLYAVSAWRDVTLESFSATFDEVYVRQAPSRTEGEPIRFRRSAALRALDSQAHVDF